MPKQETKASATASVSGVGLPGLLTVLFVGLKLTDHIDWPWLWVLAPAWIPLVLLLSCFGPLVLLAGWVHYDDLKDRP